MYMAFAIITVLKEIKIELSHYRKFTNHIKIFNLKISNQQNYLKPQHEKKRKNDGT